MITDALNTFLTRYQLAGQATGVLVSDVIDLGPLFGTNRDIGRGALLRLRVQIETAVTSGGAATLAISYEDSPNADGSSSTSRFTTAALPLASLTAGAIVVDIGLPDNYQRYLVLKTTVGTAALTGGQISAAIMFDSDSPTNAAYYPSAATVTGY